MVRYECCRIRSISILREETMKLLSAVILCVLAASYIDAKCGSRPAGTRVINGQNASPHSWPWQISLRRYGYHTCGGSLISPTWVVTAAHCIHNRSPKDYTVVAGAHRRKGTTSVQQTIRVSHFIKHPSYDDRRINNDIALLRLASPVQMSDKVGAVCLTKIKPQPGKKCYITGWGSITGSGTSPDILQQAVLPIVSHTNCKKKYFSVNSFAHLCAGEGRAGASGGCHGDSGGPLVCEEGGRWYLHGAVSFGRKNCPTTDYTVFARVASYIDWIKQVSGVGPDGSLPSIPPPTGGSPPPPTQSPGDCKDKATNCKDMIKYCDNIDMKTKWCRKTCGGCAVPPPTQGPPSPPPPPTQGPPSPPPPPTQGPQTPAPTQPADCKDKATNCKDMIKYCDNIDMKTKWCRKTCGGCAVPPPTQGPPSPPPPPTQGPPSPPPPPTQGPPS
ncbi:chymotrypsinogen A, partial [Exaiptasia diaphana]|uniref:Uncharacterized protein n=1 Tax=Exaiptasia diaphana TaxID=2652724 RepID=A0A913Y6M1_EXADI